MANTDQSIKTNVESAGDFPEPADFESAYTELEALLTQMESGQMTLAQALTAYKRGDALLQYCQKTLNAAEQEVNLLTEQQTLEPFEAD